MGHTLTNEFSWSKSRHEKFHDCRRAYYLHYYRSWGGWDIEAPEDIRRIYVLKKLSNRWTWGGSAVHDSIKRALEYARAGRELDPMREIERVHRTMQDDYRHSMARGYWRERIRRDFVGLVEHEYEEPIPREEWRQSWESVKAALIWFYQSPWLGRARALRKEQWLEVDEKDFDEGVFYLDGVKVFAVPDFAYINDDGTPVVVDWKTGKSRQGYDDQVLGYALYLSSRYQLPLEKIQAKLVYLNEGAELVVQVDRNAVEGFKGRFQSSVEGMRELLADPVANVPRGEAAFPMTNDVATCARCPFRRVCGREAKAVGPALVHVPLGDARVQAQAS